MRCCSVSRWATHERWQASGSRSTQSSAAVPLLGSPDTIAVRSARSRIGQLTAMVVAVMAAACRVPMNERMNLDEIGVFYVEGGKVVREEFFYTR